MKKIVTTAVCLLGMLPTFAGNWGLGLRGGAAQNNPESMQDAYNLYGGYVDAELTRNYGLLGAEGFLERRVNWDLAEGEEFLGIKLGADIYGKNKLKMNYGSEKATENSYAFPLTVYYKNNLGTENVSSFIGAGITSIYSKAKMEMPSFIEGNFSKTKIFPHISVGAEYRLNRLIAWGLEIKYNIAAKVKKNGYVLSDHSGIGGVITVRFYF